MAARTKRASRRRGRRSSASKLYVWIMIGFLAVSALFFGGWRIWNSDAVQMRFVYMWDYQQDIITYSEKNKIDPFLIAAIIKNESGFNHKAVSKVGAVGLMQIMPETGAWIAEQMGLKGYTEDQLYESKTNIRMGCWYVGELEHEFKRNMVLLLVAYTAGRGQAKEWMEQNSWDYDFNSPELIPYPDTREYVIKVLRDRDKYYLLYKDRIKM